jgi:hypothetical protein
MNLTNPEHPTPPRPGRLERAIDGGYTACASDLAPVAAHLRLAPEDPWMVALQMAAVQAHEVTCEDCGRRCDSCDERMCATWGPEPEPRCPAHPTCTACAEMPSCMDCAVVLRDANEGTDW